MKKLFLLAFIIAAIYFLFLNSPFKKDITFNGEVYSYLKEKNLGSIHNHIYTPNAQSVGSSKTFIQIFELEKEIKQSLWQFQLAAIFKQYELKPIADRDYEYAGNASPQPNLFFNTFAAPITVNGQNHLALYIENTGNQKKIASAEKRDQFLNELKQLKFIFN
mgnify:CR=1 FL=1